MPRLSIEDACEAEAAIEYALTALPQDAPQRADWERVHHRLRLRLDIAQSENRRRDRDHETRGKPKSPRCAARNTHSQ